MNHRRFWSFALTISLCLVPFLAHAGAAFPTLSIAPAPVPFSGQTLNTTSPPQAFVLTAAGAPSQINSITTTGDFARSGTCAANTVLAPGGTCTTPVTFSPTDIGARAGSLVINCGVVGAIGTATIICNGINQIIALSGTGVAAISQQAAIPTMGQWAITAMAGFILLLAMSRLRGQRR